MCFLVVIRYIHRIYTGLPPGKVVRGFSLRILQQGEALALAVGRQEEGFPLQVVAEAVVVGVNPLEGGVVFRTRVWGQVVGTLGKNDPEHTFF